LPVLGVMAVLGVLAWLVTDASPVAVTVAVLGGLATPLPPPPPPGELRRVRLTYRCSICGTEVRMTSANDEVPEPPRHCQEDMDLVAPIDG
jgi:hypothetical protein